MVHGGSHPFVFGPHGTERGFCWNKQDDITGVIERVYTSLHEKKGTGATTHDMLLAF